MGGADFFPPYDAMRGIIDEVNAAMLELCDAVAGLRWNEHHFLVPFVGDTGANAAFRSSCSKADAMRSISPGVRPSFAATFRHLATACPTSPATRRASPALSSK